MDYSIYNSLTKIACCCHLTRYYSVKYGSFKCHRFSGDFTNAFLACAQAGKIPCCSWYDIIIQLEYNSSCRSAPDADVKVDFRHLLEKLRIVRYSNSMKVHWHLQYIACNIVDNMSKGVFKVRRIRFQDTSS